MWGPSEWTWYGKEIEWNCKVSLGCDDCECVDYMNEGENAGFVGKRVRG